MTIYTVHQLSGWEGSELMPDFDVFISQNGATYRYLINNAPFNSFIKIVKQDAETGKTIPYRQGGNRRRPYALRLCADEGKGRTYNAPR